MPKIREAIYRTQREVRLCPKLSLLDRVEEVADRLLSRDGQ
jgi:hypothetical protein